MLLSDASRPSERIIFALDYPSLAEARAGAERVRSDVGVLKVGLELLAKEGVAAVRMGLDCGLQVFADWKLHDIPETVDRAIASVSASGARFVTVHAAGGAAMLSRAAERAERERAGLVVLAVTVLTSLDGSDLAAQAIAGSPAEHALRLARVAWTAGIRGFVCSPAEVQALRAALGPEALLVTPGVRPAGASAGNQKRVASPAEAIAAGADWLVIGRPIRDAADPGAAARRIAEEIAQGLTKRGAR